MDTTQDIELEAIQATIAAKKADVAHQGTRRVYDKHVKDFFGVEQTKWICRRDGFSR